MVLGQPRVGERGDGKPAKLAGRLDEVGEGEEGLFGQRLAVSEDTARLGVGDDPLRVEEGDGAAREDRLQVAAAALAPQLQLRLVHTEVGGGWEFGGRLRRRGGVGGRRGVAFGSGRAGQLLGLGHD